MDPLHPYQLLSLFTVGVVLAIVLIFTALVLAGPPGGR
jgi:hypothetical protein